MKLLTLECLPPSPFQSKPLSQPSPMYCRVLLHSYPTVAFPSLSSHHTLKTQSPPFFRLQFTRNFSHHRPQLSLNQTLLRPQIRCTAGTSSSTGNWDKWIPKNIVSADKVLRLISGATSSPIFQYISSPTTFLHSVDPRIKWAWLLALVILPARSNMMIRVGLITYLALVSVWVLPTPVWRDQLGRVSLLCGILFIMLGLGTDGVTPVGQLRSPPPSLIGLPNVPTSFEGYSYVIMKLGPLQLTRKGLSVASTSACLAFSIFQSVNLCLTTTTPEQLAWALQWFMLPLINFGVPVAEVILTLLLSLRFINLVFDEVRNLALGIVSRRIDWKLLTIMETIDIFFTYIRQIFKNIFNHAEQISQAMIVRGFRGDGNAHKIYFSSDTSIGMADILSLLCLVGLIGAAAVSNT